MVYENMQVSCLLPCDDTLLTATRIGTEHVILLLTLNMLQLTDSTSWIMSCWIPRDLHGGKYSHAVFLNLKVLLKPLLMVSVVLASLLGIRRAWVPQLFDKASDATTGQISLYLSPSKVQTTIRNLVPSQGWAELLVTTNAGWLPKSEKIYGPLFY